MSSSSSSTNPIIVPEDLKFYYSGGYYNSEPKLSLGGDTSSYPLVSGTLNGLFDMVDTSEAESGDVEYRCVYLRNTSQTRKLLGTKIWIESGTQSPDTAIAISIGSSGINGTEPMIPDEGTEPPMNFFEIPLQAPDEPNIGDLYPGDHIALWVRWYVKTGTQSIGDDYAVIRIDGEREPESITTPLPPDEGEPPPPPPTTGCPAGSKWSPTEARCVDDSTVIICPNGYVYNSTTQRCVPPSTPPPSVPILKFAAVGDTYNSSDTEDVFGLLQRQLNTTAGSQDLSFLIHTGDTTHIDGNVQTFFDLCQEYLGGMYPDQIAPSLGNHDSSEDGLADDGTEVINEFPLIPDSGYYAFTRRNIRIIVLNSQASYSVGSAQHTFLVAQLQQAAADPAIKWKIVAHHKPTLVSACYYGPLTDLRNIAHPLYDQYKVDLIFTGHVHVYWRTKPVKWDAANPDTPIIVSEQTTGNYINIDGRIFISDSTGGRNSHAEFDSSTPENYIANRFAPPPFGAVFITLQDNGNQLRCQWMSTTNQVLDDITISKPGATPPPTITCPSGFHYDDTLGRCVISPQQCPTNYRWEPAQNKCVAISNPPPPTSGYPITNVEWYYDSITTQNTPQTIIAGSYDATEGIILSSATQNVPSTVISGGYINVKSGDAYGRIFIDYWKKARWTQNDQPGFNVVVAFSFVYEDQISISIYDGNEPSLNFTPNTTFGGFGFNIIGPRPTGPTGSTNQSNSQVKYWTNPADFNGGPFGETITSLFPGGRELESGKTYKVFATIRTNRTTHIVFQNVWLDFGDGTGWIKIQTDRTWSASNWSPGTVTPGKTDTSQIQQGPAYIKRYHVQIRNNNSSEPRPDLKVKDIKIGTLPYLDDTTNPPPGNGGGNGGGGGTGGQLDSNGLRWYWATGSGGVISQSRDTADDDRWSAVFSGLGLRGYEVTAYFTFDGVGSDGHWAIKHWGGNHSGDCQYSEGGSCCCWYDTGIRANGDIQLQTERPHPSNHDFSLNFNATSGPLYMQNIGKSMDGNTIGMKWIVTPLRDHGTADNGGIHLQMYCDTDGFVNSKPQNKWRKCYDFIDTGQVLGDYPAPDEQEIESRNSNTADRDQYGGGIHWRRILATDTDQFNAGGGGGGNPPPPPPPPPSGGAGEAFFAVVDGFNNYTDMTNVLTHEIVEQMANPYYDSAPAFASSNGQDDISDICSSNENIQIGTGGDDLIVNSYYSNRRGGCVAPPVLMPSNSPTTAVRDFGGPILNNCVIYMIFWGSGWSTRSTTPTRAGIESRIQLLCSAQYNQYFSEFTQYRSIQPPTYGGSVINDYSQLGSTYNDENVSFVVKDALDRNALPYNSQGLYLIVPYVGVTNINGYDGSADHFNYQRGSSIPPGTAFKFNVGGDFRSGSDAEATATNLVSDSPNVIFMVGDYAVGDATEEAWTREIMAPVYNSGIPVWGCLGNHDNNDYLSVGFFENTSWSWSTKFGNVVFIGADTIAENVTQTQTLCAAAQADSTVNRIVIFMHEGVFKQTGGGTSGSDTTIQFHNMFVQYSKIKLVIAGHSHNYTRFAAYQGIVYVINEDGGQQPDDNTGCMHCSVDAAGSITCRMIPNTGGELDNFTITAAGGLPTGGTLLPTTGGGIGGGEKLLPVAVVRIGPDEDYDALDNKKKLEVQKEKENIMRTRRTRPRRTKLTTHHHHHHLPFFSS